MRVFRVERRARSFVARACVRGWELERAGTAARKSRRRCERGAGVRARVLVTRDVTDRCATRPEFISEARSDLFGLLVSTEDDLFGATGDRRSKTRAISRIQRVADAISAKLRG